MQTKDGTMVGVTEKQYDAMIGDGNRKLCRVGDVFKIRHCYFEVETLGEVGIVAKGISRKEYFDKKKRQIP